MADNIAVTQGSGTTMASDDISSVQYPRIKISWGVDGSAVDASASNPFPVVQTGTLNIGTVTTVTTVSAVTAISNALPAGTNNIGDVDVLSVVPGTGATNLGKAIDTALGATDTVVLAGSVRDDALATLTEADGDVSVLRVTSVGRLWVSATVDAALPAGNNNIGDVDIASALPAGTNNIGDVDVLSIVPGTSATSLGKAEDAAHSSGDTGVMALAVRSDAGAALAADGDYIPLMVNSSGALYVTGGGGGTEYTEDIAAPANPVGTAMQMVRADSLAGLVSADGDWLAARATDKGEQYVKHVDTIPVTQSGTWNVASITSSVIPGTAATNLGKAEDAASAAGDTLVGIAIVRRDTASSGVGTDADYGSPSMDANGKLWTNAEVTAVIPGTGATNLGKAEDAIHASGDVGVMSLVVRNDAGTALSADGDYTPLTVNSAGALYVTGGGGGTQYQVDDAAGATATGTLSLVVRDDALATLTPADGDYTQLRVTSVGRLWASATIDAALPAGTNAIGKLAANSGIDIGDVDVTSVTPGSGANNLGKLEDDAHSSADLGVMALAVRRNTAASGTSADGDYASINVDTNGKVWVNSEVTSMVPGTAATNLGKAEDAAHSSGDTGVMSLAVRNDAGTALAADGDYIPLMVNSAGALYVTGAGGGTQYQVDGAAGGTDTGTLSLVVRDDALTTLTPADNDYTQLRVTSVGRLWVSSALDTALPAGTNAVGSIVSITTSIVPGTAATNLGKAEDDAHSSGDVGVLALAVRRNSATSGTSADGDNATLNVDTNGKLWTSPSARTVDTMSSSLATDAIMEGTTALTPKFAIIDAATSGDNTLLAAVSSKKIRVLSLYIVASAAVTVRFESGTGGTALSGQMQLAANGGFVLPFNPVGWFETAATTLLNLELSGAISVDGGFQYVEAS